MSPVTDIDDSGLGTNDYWVWFDLLSQSLATAAVIFYRPEITFMLIGSNFTFLCDILHNHTCCYRSLLSLFICNLQLCGGFRDKVLWNHIHHLTWRRIAKCCGRRWKASVHLHFEHIDKFDLWCCYITSYSAWVWWITNQYNLVQAKGQWCILRLL